MDRLIWPEVKVQLYLVEAAYVKNVVGRDKIRRNKDALRELRCHQEILADVHAGEFGRSAPSQRREACEAAAKRWASMRKAVASAPGLEAPVIPPSVKRYFIVALPSVEERTGQDSGDDDLDDVGSTRAPSTVKYELDAQSSATDSRSEVAALTDGTLTRRSPGQRMSREQLDVLSAGLKEQLDQEYTSLMASIEEVQGLMEAAVVGAELLPCWDDLAAFREEMDRWSQRTAIGAIPELPKADVAEDRILQLESVCSGGTRLSQDDFGSAEPTQSAPSRQRWADFAADSDDEVLKATRSAAESIRILRDSCSSAFALCCKCEQMLGRKEFSRRMWRQARGLDPNGCKRPTEAVCTSCTGVAKGSTFSARVTTSWRTR